MRMKKTIYLMTQHYLLASALGLALCVGSACADTTISTGGTYTIDNSNTTSNSVYRIWNDTGTLTMSNGATLVVQPSQKPPTNYFADAVLFAGGAGTITMKFNDNDTDFLWTNSVSSSATGPQTLAVYTGYLGNGDRESVTFKSGVPDGANGNALSLAVNFYVFTSGAYSYVNLSGASTFTGSITETRTGGNGLCYLTIGGTLTRYLGNTVGSGSLNNGNYSGAIALGGGTIFNYASTTPQTLAGPISGVGAVQVTGNGGLTLAGTNTYTGNTTISTGCSLVLATNGVIKFLVTDTTNNVVSGSGTASATFNGTFTLDVSAVTATSNSWTLISGITNKTFGPNFALTGFTGPIGNLYSAIIGSKAYTFNKTNGVLQVNTPAQITSFGVPNYPGVINQGNKTIALTIPSTIPLSTLAPTYTLTSGTCNQASGSPPSPTFAVQNPATYTVVDGTFTNNYVVTVSVVDLSSRLYSAPFYVLTTTNGANLPASALETNFPILLRLNPNNFNFSQAQTNGADILFTTANSNSLPYEIEQWDAVNGTASVWVQVPGIQGGTNQRLLMFWGNTNAISQSSGSAVFNSANGYACVFHLNGITDSTGTLPTPTDTGTTATNGAVGPARHFSGTVGLNCGSSLTTLPSGGNPHTTEAWFRGASSGGSLVGWGIQQGQGKVIVNLASPPHIQLDTFFGPNPNGATSLSLGQWYHTAYTYNNGSAKLYVNGVLDGSANGTLNIPNPARMYVGGWYDSYSFAGDIAEVRISSVARSTNWLWLEYQNQNPLQTLVGNLVQPGNTFAVSAASVTMNEGATSNLTAQAGGAIKVYWLLKQNGQTNVIAVDSFNCTLASGRISGNQSYTVQFKAIYADGSIQTTDIPVTVLDTMPDPIFTLTASTNLWDGRSTLTVTPVISNWAALVAAGATNLNYKWNVAGVAVTAQTPSDRTTPGVFTTTNLVLLRSQGSGVLTATLALDNGGTPAINSTSVSVQEPATDAWVVRTPDANEKPVNNQFYARDNTGYGTIYYNGTIGGSPDSVFLNVYSNAVLYTNISVVPASGVYALSARIPGGLITYIVQFGSVTAGVTNVLDTETNLVCGDAYIIEGQSNAEAKNHYGTSNNYSINTYTNPWIRTFGTQGPNTTTGATSGGWGYAVGDPGSGLYEIGIWGMCLASNLVANYQIPICIMNGAVGGTMIAAHQANPTNHYDAGGGTYSIYANLVTRVAAANLTHGIRGVLWHQGENDQTAADPTGNYDYVNYQSYFMNMSGAWKQDFPNIQHYYIFQIYPNACAIGGRYWSDMIREVQRELPSLYSNMSIMSTLAQPTGSSCHFYSPDYCQLAYNMFPLVARDNYGLVPTNDITAPNVISAAFTTTNRNQIALVFNQKMSWNNAVTANFYLDRLPGWVAAGSVSNNVITLALSGSSTNQTIDYLVDQYWTSTSTTNFPAMLTGSNGIAALTFYAVPIAPPPVVASPAPALNSLSPNTGSTNGGTVVTLTGSNFLSGASVRFGGGSATSVSVSSSTQITAATPASAPGTVDVVVVNTNGLAATNLNAFTYVPPPAPARLSGFGQSGNNLVMVWAGGTNQSCVLLSATNLLQPRSTWIPVATNPVGANGFSTNAIPVNPGSVQSYYLLSIPYN